MIVSRDGKSYDSSDGSEQPHAASVAPRQRSDREEINRWEDDGPGPRARPAPPPAAAATKPAWSVLSLRGLLDAIRLMGRSGDEARLRRQAERAGAAAQHDEQRTAVADNARRDRYRNAWENT